MFACVRAIWLQSIFIFGGPSAHLAANCVNPVVHEFVIGTKRPSRRFRELYYCDTPLLLPIILWSGLTVSPVLPWAVDPRRSFLPRRQSTRKWAALFSEVYVTRVGQPIRVEDPGDCTAHLPKTAFADWSRLDLNRCCEGERERQCETGKLPTCKARQNFLMCFTKEHVQSNFMRFVGSL